MNNIYIVIHHPYNKLKMFFESEGTLRQHILQTFSFFDKYRIYQIYR